MPISPAGSETLTTWQLPIAQLCDSALPTGAFSHSFGLETYTSTLTPTGVGITDEQTFISWLRHMIQTQLTFSDGLAIRELMGNLTFDAVQDFFPKCFPEIELIDQQLVALTLARQVRDANRTMGKRMVQITQMVAPSPLIDWYAEQITNGMLAGHPAVVLALVGGDLGAPVAAIIAAHIQAVATSLTQNAVRAIPLGQNAGQRALSAVRPDIEQAVKRALVADRTAMGRTVPGLEIAQMRHERLTARMFMS
jgi:urease accessory protein